MRWEEVSIIDLEARISPEILARGRNYYQDGHLLSACKFEEILAGELAGTKGNYRVRLWLREDKITGDCQCPYPGFCKHMAALVIAWVENSLQFFDLNPHLEKAVLKPGKLQELLRQLIQMDPLNFLAILQPSLPEANFLTARGILNLIRNTFNSHFLTHQESGELWERIKRVQKLIVTAINRKEKAAPELLGEFLAGMAVVYREYPDPLMEDVFRELCAIAETLPGVWAGERVRALADVLLSFCLEPGLWQLADSARAALAPFHRELPGWLFEKLEDHDWEVLGQVELIAYYELLTFLTSRNLPGKEYLERIISVLEKTPEGCLWLIDRLMDIDLDRAYVLAKGGIKTGGEMKPAFRERLIGIHLKRGENKQAAALSFIQFQENPNFEEYLRLKSILTPYPRDWHSYLRKMEELATGPELAGIAAQIALERRDWLKLEAEINRIGSGEAFLKELAGLASFINDEGSFSVYQTLICRLLAGERGNWEIALRLIKEYKKKCKEKNRGNEWENLRLRLNAEYGEDRRFARKFGAILAD